MAKGIGCSRFVMLGITVLGLSLAPRISRADSSCTSLLANHPDQYGSHNGWSAAITITRDPLKYIEYIDFTSNNWLWWSSPYYTGTTQMQFDDRRNGTQNFSVNATESVTAWIDANGHLWIYNNKYSYWIVNNLDLHCSGNVGWGYQSGVGVATVQLKDLAWPIP